MTKTEFLQHTAELKRVNNFHLYDTVFKQSVYTGTQEQCRQVLNNAINPAYHRDFIIIEAS